MKFTMNVGLLNNPLTAKETVEYLSDRPGYSVIKYKVACLGCCSESRS